VCSNDVDPASDVQDVDASAPVYEYQELSPEAKRAFDRARSAEGSVTTDDGACPEEFDYGVDRGQYVIVQGDSRYVLTTYDDDLLPEVPIAAGSVAYLGVALVGIGLATRRDRDARYPALIAVVGATALVAVTAAVVLDQALWYAVGWTWVVTAGTFVGAGATLRLRSATLVGGGAALLAAAVLVPVGSVSVGLLVPALGPLSLVGIGAVAEALGSSLVEQLAHTDG